MKYLSKPILLLLGHLCVALGAIGAIIPILPTTPFFILAAFAYSKSSPRMHSWLTSLPYFGNAILDWEKNRVIKLKAKIMASSVLMIVMGSSIYFVMVGRELQVLLGLIAVSVLIFIWTRKSTIE